MASTSLSSDRAAPPSAPSKSARSSSPPPSSSTSPAASPIPPELVIRIFELAATYTPETYPARQALLASCCLVSQHWRAIAQPLLNESIQILATEASYEEKADKCLEALQASQGNRMGWRPNCGLSSSTPMALCSPLIRLRHLALDNVILQAANLTLPSLESLSLSSVHLPVGLVRHPPPIPNCLFCESGYPSLRHLLWRDVSYFFDDISPSAQAVDGYLDRVEVFCLDRPDPALPVDDPRVLYDLDVADPEGTNGAVLDVARHVRLHCREEGGDEDTLLTLLGAFKLSLTDRPESPLSLLYLPTALLVPPRPSPHYRLELDHLLALCVERHIRVDYEDARTSVGTFSISEKFRKYVEQKKQEKQGR
ncbi:hypothetical protein JCM8097_000974 [Rhodosporidiobolus ruineniae]